MRAMVLAVVVLALIATSAHPGAQQAGFKRTVIQQRDLSVNGLEVVTAIAEFQAHATVGPHTHPGEEVGYLLEGSLLLEQEGKSPVTLTAGGTFFIPPNTVHNATNTTASTARVLATYIVEKRKPLATPVASK